METKDWVIAAICAIPMSYLPVLLEACFERRRGTTPRVLLRVAAAVMPREQRQEMHEEWLAEVAEILGRKDLGRWRRSHDAYSFAWSLLVQAHRVRGATRRLTRSSPAPDVPASVRAARRAAYWSLGVGVGTIATAFTDSTTWVIAMMVSCGGLVLASACGVLLLAQKVERAK